MHFRALRDAARNFKQWIKLFLGGRTHVVYGGVALILFNLLQAFHVEINGTFLYLQGNIAGIINAVVITGITTDLVAHLYKH